MPEIDRAGKVRRMIEDGILIDPVDHSRLAIQADELRGGEGRRYRYATGIPVLLAPLADYGAYVAESQGMAEEYATESEKAEEPLRRRILRRFDLFVERVLLRTTYQSEPCKRALNQLFAGVTHEEICVSIGGGPLREDERLLNYNIGPFPNVEIVGDAHVLAFSDDSVDRLKIDAVLEHLVDPDRAVEEVRRVLKPGGLVYACTPFLQPYHGYPNHFQNFTLSGHVQLLKEHGLEIVSSGVAVGPVYAMYDMRANFAANFYPKPLNLIVHRFWVLWGALFRPLDKRLLKRSRAAYMASTTFVLARKPSL